MGIAVTQIENAKCGADLFDRGFILYSVVTLEADLAWMSASWKRWQCEVRDRGNVQREIMARLAGR